jgi:hypothetical protein
MGVEYPSTIPHIVPVRVNLFHRLHTIATETNYTAESWESLCRQGKLKNDFCLCTIGSLPPDDAGKNQQRLFFHFPKVPSNHKNRLAILQNAPTGPCATFLAKLKKRRDAEARVRPLYIV